MAVTQSLTDFISFAAGGDTVASSRKLLLAGFIFAKPNVTTQVTMRVRDGASQFDIIPTSVFASAVQPPPLMFPQPMPVAGLKAVTCTNVTIIAILKGLS
jgi:hypothetical protein